MFFRFLKKIFNSFFLSCFNFWNCVLTTIVWLYQQIHLQHYMFEANPGCWMCFLISAGQAWVRCRDAGFRVRRLEEASISSLCTSFCADSIFNLLLFLFLFVLLLLLPLLILLANATDSAPPTIMDHYLFSLFVLASYHSRSSVFAYVSFCSLSFPFSHYFL